MDRDSNYLLDLGPQVIVVPEARDVISPKDPREFAIRLNELHSPKQRLAIMLRSVLDPTSHHVTKEAFDIRLLTLYSATIGAFYGAFIKSQDHRERFIRQNNAAAFQHNFFAQRKYYDTMVHKISVQAAKYAIRTGFLGGSMAIISYGSLVYRNQVYIPDWLIGYSLVGAIYRFPHGSRGMLVGAILGCYLGGLATLFVQGVEWFRGMSIQQVRYLNHSEWLAKQEERLKLIRARGEKAQKDKFENLDSGNPFMID